MSLFLSDDIQRLIRERVGAGKYQTPDEVVGAALAALDRQERTGDFEPGELDRLLAEGEADIASGHVLEADKAFEQRRARRGTRSRYPVHP